MPQLNEKTPICKYCLLPFVRNNFYFPNEWAHPHDPPTFDQDVSDCAGCSSFKYTWENRFEMIFYET